MLREKTANSPLLLIRRALQLFALAASRKGCKAAFRKSQHAHKGKRFFSSLPGLTRCPFPTIESVKGSCTRLCEKSDKKQGRNAQLPPSFLFFSPLFQRTTPFINRFLEEVTPNTYGNSANTLARETASDRHSTQNTRRHSLAMPVLRTAERPTCVCLPPSHSFVRAQKKQPSIFRWIAV
jgi:hypothetical protein